MQQSLATAFFARNPSDYSVEDNWQFFKTGLMEILHKRGPVKKLDSWSDTPWMARDFKRLLRKKKRLYNNYKRSNYRVDKQKYRQFQKHLNGKLRKAEDDFIAATLDIQPNDRP